VTSLEGWGSTIELHPHGALGYRRSRFSRDAQIRHCQQSDPWMIRFTSCDRIRQPLALRPRHEVKDASHVDVVFRACRLRLVQHLDLRSAVRNTGPRSSDEFLPREADVRVSPESPTYVIPIGKYHFDRPRFLTRESTPDTKNMGRNIVPSHPWPEAAMPHDVQVPAVEHIEEGVAVLSEYLDVDIVMRTSDPTDEQVDGVASSNPPVHVESGKSIVHLIDRQRSPCVTHPAIFVHPLTYHVDMDSSTWDQRYEGSDLVWSAEPNIFLPPLVEGVAPGSALDVACGEGRNAIWLARQGWDVTAFDFSAVGIDKAREHAGDTHLEWIVADATSFEPTKRFDLVVIFYLHLPAVPFTQAFTHAVNALGAGGTLFAVGHSLANIEDGVGGPPYPEILWTVDGITPLLDGLSTIELEERERYVESVDATAIDVVVWATRPSN
jgi:SAM-dependent methyltransferase